MLDGENSAELSNLIGSGNPNAAAMPYIDDGGAGTTRRCFPTPREQKKLRDAEGPAAQGAPADEPLLDRDQGPLIARLRAALADRLPGRRCRAP